MITILLYVLSEKDMSFQEIIKLGTIIYIFGFLTVIISGCFHFYRISFHHSMKSSIIASEALYLFGLFIYFYIDKENTAENFMWLPVAAIFIVLYAFPMALLVSYGTGKLVFLITNKGT